MRSNLLKAMVVATLATAPVAAFADSAPGEVKGDWIVRAGIAQLNPQSENLNLTPAATNWIDPRGTFIVVDSDISADLDVTYMFSNHFGVELLLAYPFTHGIDSKPYAGGEARVGYVDVLPPTLSLVWRPRSDAAKLQPYLGVGATYAMFSGEESNIAALGLSVDDEIAPAGTLGLDIFPGDERKWFLNANVRYIDLTADVTVNRTVAPAGFSGNELSGELELNPMFYALNVGRRFGAPAPVVEPPPPPPPPPAPVVEEKCADTDGDGVCDTADKCASTAAGTAVDKFGCPCAQELKVLFDFDKAELRPESITELERVVTFMNDVPVATSMVEGHTDSVGNDAYNLALSDRRAKAVFDYLTSRGVDPARLSSAGKGEGAPIGDNATDEGRQQNRRVMLNRTDACAK